MTSLIFVHHHHKEEQIRQESIDRQQGLKTDGLCLPDLDCLGSASQSIPVADSWTTTATPAINTSLTGASSSLGSCCC
jgi:hypothetical protein